MKNPKLVKIASIVLMVAFLLLQVLVKRTMNNGPWCFPALDSSSSEGRPTQYVIAYGFPIPVAGFVTNMCAEPPSTGFTSFASGLVIDGLILLALSFPLWRVKLKTMNKPYPSSKEEEV
jgi:hypothetical protein